MGRPAPRRGQVALATAGKVPALRPKAEIFITTIKILNCTFQPHRLYQRIEQLGSESYVWHSFPGDEECCRTAAGWIESHKMAWPSSNVHGLPPAQGLYDPAHEHDACGMGFVASVKGQKSHDIVRKGIQVLISLTHRGACGCDPETGDGAGILIQIPHTFFARECARLGFELPAPG